MSVSGVDSRKNGRVTSSGVSVKAKKKSKYKFLNISGGFDIPFFITLLLLLAIGLIMMFSASYPSAYYYTGDSYSYFVPQLFFAIAGVGVMLVVSLVDYHQLRRWSYVIYLISVVLLVVVLLVPSEDGSVKRWITIGVQFQPSEIAKFATILILACWASAHFNEMESIKTGILKPGAFSLITCALLIAEPHYSCTAIILMLTVVMLYLSGVKLRYFIIALSILAVGITVLYFAGLLSYVQERFDGWGTALTYINDYQWQTQTWQTRNSLYAIGSGGLTGLGPGQSRQKYLFLPEPQNDFIFAIVCEELGFVGAAIILILFGYLVYRGITVCLKAPDNFGKLLGIGLCAQIGLQVILNVLVITDWMPNTGISLPFFSYGGTSMMMLLAQMGVVLSITRHARTEKY